MIPIENGWVLIMGGKMHSLGKTKLFRESLIFCANSAFSRPNSKKFNQICLKNRPELVRKTSAKTPQTAAKTVKRAQTLISARGCFFHELQNLDI